MFLDIFVSRSVSDTYLYHTIFETGRHGTKKVLFIFQGIPNEKGQQGYPADQIGHDKYVVVSYVIHQFLFSLHHIENRKTPTSVLVIHQQVE